jgi:hypothetical protein
MSQTPSFTITNDAGAAVRARINEVITALQTLNAGPTEPADTRAGMAWIDTSTNPATLRIRNTTDTGWDVLLDGGSY